MASNNKWHEKCRKMAWKIHDPDVHVCFGLLVLHVRLVLLNVVVGNLLDTVIACCPFIWYYVTHFIYLYHTLIYICLVTYIYHTHILDLRRRTVSSGMNWVPIVNIHAQFTFGSGWFHTFYILYVCYFTHFHLIYFEFTFYPFGSLYHVVGWLRCWIRLRLDSIPVRTFIMAKVKFHLSPSPSYVI